jgi:O6-methylguanine-DNA--protein-cysteine methyltransferase
MGEGKIYYFKAYSRDIGKEGHVAGTTLREIYCWEVPIDALKIYLASTKKGALQIGLTLEKQCDCMAFFRRLFPNAELSKDYDLNLPLIQGVEAAVLDRNPGKIPDLDFSCTPFQWQVLKAITKIPFGETRRYGEVGDMVGKPKGARAVGQALGKNPLPLIFP